MADEHGSQTADAGDTEKTVVKAEPSAATGPYFTELFLTSSDPSPNTIGTFVDRETPGNVGVCLSGGGSRAFSAGIGQLQALEALQVNGSSLLNQTRAISTVSGGGWIGIPFVFLPLNVSDSEFLGGYVAPADLTYDGLSDLPTQGIANCITSGFSIADLSVQALLLYADDGVPSSELWQVLMGETFLEPYGLYVPGTDDLPTQFFSDDSASLAAIRKVNPGLADETAGLVAQVDGQQRPYLISLSSLSVSVGSQQFLLAPVHTTPFIAGVLSTPPKAFDANGRQVGGGGIWSFAFDSDPISPTNDLTRIIQSSQWSLTDALGTSSAAFAQTLIDQMTAWNRSPTRFAAALRRHGPKAVQKLARSPEQAARLQAKLDTAIAASPAGSLAGSRLHQSLRELAVLQSIVPQYQYWSPAAPPTTAAVSRSDFADGGSLENTGVASMLSYTDIANVIAFLNVETALSQDDQGVIVVDDCLPPLFGYQPYVEGTGYVLYSETTEPSQPVFQYNQVFASADFSTLLQNLWSTSDNATAPAIVSQTLTTVANSWFNVAGDTDVTVVWVYLNYANDWYKAISDGLVQDAVDVEYELHNFPNYDTLKTELSATQINLLSSFSSWMVQNSNNSGTFTALYADAQQAR